MLDKFFTNPRRKALGTAFIDIFKGSAIAILVGDVFVKLNVLFKIVFIAAIVIIAAIGLIVLPKEEE